MLNINSLQKTTYSKVKNRSFSQRASTPGGPFLGLPGVPGGSPPQGSPPRGSPGGSPRGVPRGVPGGGFLQTPPCALYIPPFRRSRRKPLQRRFQCDFYIAPNQGQNRPLGLRIRRKMAQKVRTRFFHLLFTFFARSETERFFAVFDHFVLYQDIGKNGDFWGVPFWSFVKSEKPEKRGFFVYYVSLKKM